MNAPLAFPVDGDALPCRIESNPIDIDPRPCELCGLTIDRHEMVDDGEGPEFYCPEPDKLTLDELQRRADLIRQIEIAAIVRGMELNDARDAWRYTGEAPPPISAAAPGPRSHYRTPQATVEAFWFVVRLDDPDYLARWLAQHPADGSHLFKLWKAKQC